LAVLAVHVVAEPACPTQPAGDQRVQDHLVTDGHIGHCVTDGMHPSGVLVSDGVRQFDPGLGLPLAFQDMEVGAADAGAADPDDDVERAVDLGLGYVGELQLGVISDDLYGFHRGLPVLVLVNRVAASVFPPPSSS
jgi:hypothetical protein